MEERTELIRTEVVLHNSNKSYCAPIIRRSYLLGLQVWLGAILLLVFVFVLGRTNYKETVAARGILQPSQGTQKIVAPVNAMLQQTYVEVGDSVFKGQVLATLSTTQFDYSGRPQQDLQTRQLESSRVLLGQEMDVQRKLYVRTKAKNKSAVESLELRRENLEREATILRIQLKLSNTNLESLEHLRKSSNISQAYFDQQYLVHLNIRLQQEELNRRLVEVNHQLSNSAGAVEFIEFEFEKNQLQALKETKEIDYHIEQLGRQPFMTVLAEDSGIVAAVAVSRGKAVSAGQPLFTIHPSNDHLVANLYVPAKIQGKLFPGQGVLLSYDAFDYQLFGRYTANVSELSQASLDPREQLLPVPGISEPVFKVVAVLDQTYVEGLDIFPLQAGMLLTADFVVSQMSLLEFIFKPLLSLRGKV